MVLPAEKLKRALGIYLEAVYPTGVPAGVRERVGALGPLAEGMVALEKLEREMPGERYVLRLGQPMYPHMKLVIEGVPGGGMACHGQDFLLRVDAHDRHLHAAAGSPDEAWLAKVRASNQELVEKIEGAWAGEGLPTFKEYLREQLRRRKGG